MVAFSKFITSQRGGKLLVDSDGYIYSKKKPLKFYTLYICSKTSRKKKKEDDSTTEQCSAKLAFYDEMNITRTTEHNHEPVPGEVEALEIKTGIKRKAKDQRLTSTKVIVAETLAAADADGIQVDHILPPVPALHRLSAEDELSRGA